MKDKVAIVTGAAQGMGFAIASLFLAEGARVALVDVNAEGLGRAMAALGRAGPNALACTADISDAVSVRLSLIHI